MNKNLKILVLTKYDRKGASSRLRTIQYFKYMNQNGIEVEHSPLFDDSYLDNLYNDKKISKFYIIKRYCKRVLKLLSCKRYDLLWIEKELFPWIPINIEGILVKLGIKYIVDYDDAIFHNYDLHPKKLVRSLLSKKIPNVMKNASVVIVCNDYLKEKAVSSGSKNIKMIPTVVNLAKYNHIQTNQNHSYLTIGWIGSPFTEKYIIDLMDVFELLSSTIDFKLMIIGGGKFHTDKFDYEMIDWSKDKEVELILQFDIGIMPLSDSLWERGKCGYKLIQYMACEKPVIASAIGMNRNIVQNGKNGYLVKTKEEWINAFTNLNQKDRRDDFGKLAKKSVEEKYSLSITSPQIIKIIKESV